MSGTGYKVLGFVVWKGGVWYVKRRYGTTGRRVGAGALALTAVAVAGAIAVVQRRNGASG